MRTSISLMPFCDLERLSNPHFEMQIHGLERIEFRSPARGAAPARYIATVAEIRQNP